LACKEIPYSFQYPKATTWIYRIGVNPGVYMPVALEIAPLANPKSQTPGLTLNRKILGGCRQSPHEKI
jgi:hypothetical protein